MSARRWVCPTCGNGVLAPGRPRLDDVRRYCLGCSKKTGRLVKRTCPAAEAERAAKSERAATKRTATAERSKAAAVAKTTVGGLHLAEEARRLWRLPSMKNLHRGRRLPTIEWRRRTYARTTGRCWGSRIVMTVGANRAGAVEVLLHELVHSAVGCYHGHDDHFQRALRLAAREAWPTADWAWATPSNYHRLDGQIAKAIEPVLSPEHVL